MRVSAVKMNTRKQNIDDPEYLPRAAPIERASIERAPRPRRRRIRKPCCAVDEVSSSSKILNCERITKNERSCATTAIPTPLSRPNSPPLMECVVKVEPEDAFEESPQPLTTSAPTGSPAFPPSSALYKDCATSTDSIPSSTLVQPVQRVFNYGSEPESDDSSDEDAIASRPVPRTAQMMMEMPDATPAASDSAAVSVPAATPTTEQDWQVGGYLPNNFYDFKWTPLPKPPIRPELRREPFSNNNIGPTAHYREPYDTFIAIWDTKFMEHIASETNKYAQQLTLQMIHNRTLKPTSRISDWRDTSVDELYVYFAIVLAMGIVVQTRLEEYWSTNNDIFSTPGFRVVMSLRRFQLLSKCLHFIDNENLPAQELDASEAKLFKIQPLLSHLNNKFQTMYNMDQNIAIDQSLLQWKGRLDFKQIVPNKVTPVGLRTYEVCESQTGYLWRFEVHAHKKALPLLQQSDPLNASTPTIVLRLVRDLENKGHTLWMDNYYNSPALARKLKSLGFDCAGTLRTNRQFVPEDLNNLTKLNMRPGQIVGFTSGDVDLMVWRDQNRVAMISTYHGNDITFVDGTPKPILVHDYNIMMGGVDKKDHTLAMYPVERKRNRIWYKKFFRRLLNVSVLNSYILVNKSSPSSVSHRSFRMLLIQSLLKKHHIPIVLPTISQRSTVYDVKDHHLGEYPFLRDNSARQRRQCSVCKKRVHFYCVGCAKAICLSPCFVSLHA